MDHERPKRREKRRPEIQSHDALKALAFAYVARFSTSRAKLIRYLARKLREANADHLRPDMEIVADRMIELGLVDDQGYAEMRTASLARRGYGPRRVTADLRASGIAEADAAELARSMDELEIATAFAKRKRLGPFFPGEADRKHLDRALGAMMRAGHSFDVARKVLFDTMDNGDGD